MPVMANNTTFIPFLSTHYSKAVIPPLFSPCSAPNVCGIKNDVSPLRRSGLVDDPEVKGESLWALMSSEILLLGMLKSSL